jgi:S-formylglutathione hydrolase FrmB
MAQLRTLTSFILLLFSSVTALAAGRVQCGEVRSQAVGHPVAFCALLPPSYDAQPKKQFPVLYFLHGIGEDQSFLVTSGAWTIMEEAQEQKRLGEFVIITPAAGRSFYINSKDGRLRYADFFIREFIPAMERSFRISRARGGRAIGGVSMGGYGALRFAFKYPQMFSSVAALMPALMQSLPQGSSNLNLTAFIGPAFGRPLDEAFWRANTPFVYARTANLTGLQIYFATGDQDEYGFDAGTRQLDHLLTQRHVAHVAHIYPGSHSPGFVAAHIEEALQFAWNAFTMK